MKTDQMYYNPRFEFMKIKKLVQARFQNKSIEF